MSLDEPRFATLADATLGRIADAVEDAIGDTADVELQHGILTISLTGGRQYVINKHAPNRQIWLSSPVSGAVHFDWRDGDWISTRDPAVELIAVLAGELGVGI